MTPTEIARTVHNAITELASAYGMAFTLLGTENAALRAKLALAEQDTRETAKAIEGLKKAHAEALELAKRDESMAGVKCVGTSTSPHDPKSTSTVVSYFVPKEASGLSEDSIVIHVSPEQARWLAIRLEALTNNVHVKAVQLSVLEAVSKTIGRD